MEGIIIPPMAETVAALEPEMAPKKPEASTVITLSAPGTQPISAFAKEIMRFEMPPLSMMPPASIKKGTAMKGKESMAVNIFWGSTTRFPPSPPTTIAVPQARVRQTAIGTFKRSSPSSTKNNAAVITAPPPFPLCG